MISIRTSDPDSKRGDLMPALHRAQALRGLLGCGGPGRIPGRHRTRTAHPGRRLEALYAGTSRLVSANDRNALAQAAYDAFYDHHPLVLSPDAVWFSLAQGFAAHVQSNAETLRHRFVRHQGVATLTVERPDFVLGEPNPWPEVFAAFSEQIAVHVGKLRDLVVADFSTTGPVERAASEVVLMDAFQAYFEYEMRCGCGIPEMVLLGTPDDWKSVRNRAAVFSEFELDWWVRPLLPVLDAILDAAEGRADVGFWRSFFRYESGSGPAELTGWINTLFPYLRTASDALERNPHLAEWEPCLRRAEARKGFLLDPQGPHIGQLPSSIASAPVKVVDLRTGEKTALRFAAGMFGVAQDPETRALQPEFGWAVVADPAATAARTDSTT